MPKWSLIQTANVPSVYGGYNKKYTFKCSDCGMVKHKSSTIPPPVHMDCGGPGGPFSGNPTYQWIQQSAVVSGIPGPGVIDPPGPTAGCKCNNCGG